MPHSRLAAPNDLKVVADYQTDATATTSPDADEEVTRQSDLARLRSLASEFERAHADGQVAGFVAELAARFSAEHSGLNLLTYHRAKGLEFDAICLPRLVDGELSGTHNLEAVFRPTRAPCSPGAWSEAVTALPTASVPGSR